ncbi:hypothetical protein DFJ74DRAFT_670740 [Hyaloraphidium curvatum]|nr:hypothetical protein DFJ74DRAFT_670740 [Hyaloraphidium curvatum]
MKPDGTRCGGSTPHAAWCGVSAKGSPNRCIKSCADDAYVLVTPYTVYGETGQISCLGSDYNTCTWFSDAGCSVLKPLAKPALQMVPGALCPPGGGPVPWCKEAWQQLYLNMPQTQCGVPPPPPPSGGCKAPTGGPNYGGSAFRCLQDGYGSDSYVPVKLTAWQNAACMSLNSRDCIWTDKACCEQLAATADGSTPYFECGPIHAGVWGDSGYEDPKGWCTRTMQSFGVQPPVPPPPPPVTDTVQLCEYWPESPCLNYLSSNAVQQGIDLCKSITSRYSGYIYADAYLGSQSPCPTNSRQIRAQCVREGAGGDCQRTWTAKVEWKRYAGGDSFCPTSAFAGCLDGCGVSQAAGQFPVSSNSAVIEAECRGSELWCQCANKV